MTAKMTRRSCLYLVGFSPALALPASMFLDREAQVVEIAGDGTAPLQVVLDKQYGYTQQLVRDLPTGATIDARGAKFTVANSQNPHPDSAMTCDVGAQKVNYYPLVIRNCPSARLIGGRFDGEVPLGSDWRYTYCNSAAILVRDGSTKATIEGVRARRCWDGIRFRGDAGGFRLKGCWLSDIRDDAVENDYLLSGTVEDCLFERCFSGISLDPAKKDRDGTRELVSIDRTLIGMGAYLAKGEVTHQAPVKCSEVSPRLKITGSVFALAAANMRGYPRLERTWRKMVDSRDNMLLWLSDEPIPDTLPLPPTGFQLLKGAAARNYWEKSRQAWLDAHPDIARFSDEAL